MKKKFIRTFCGIAFICSISLVSALDFGGSLDLSGAYSVSAFTPNAKTSLWLQVPIADIANFSVEGSYGLSYSAKTVQQNLDLSLLKANFLLNPNTDTTMKIDVGRFKIADEKSAIYSQVIDGASFGIVLPSISLSAATGYTGLTNAKSYTGTQATYDVKTLYPLAPSLMIARVGVSVPNYIDSHNFAVDVSGFIPFVNNETKSIYGEFSVNGPILQSLSYDGAFSFGVFAGSDVTVGVAGSLDLSYFFSAFSSSLALSADFATDTYRPFSTAAVTVDGAKNMNGVLKTGLGFTIKPISSLLCMLNADFVMDIVGATMTSNCVQGSLMSMWQILSDVSANFTGNVKVPLSKGDIFYSISAGLSLYY